MRCFVAVELDQAIRVGAARLQRELARANVAVRWVRPEQMHITLKFLGDVSESTVPEIGRVVAEVAATASPFSFDVSGAGCFPPAGRHVRVVWAGIKDAGGALAACRRQLETRLAALGIPPEPKPFSPHLTLGRPRTPPKAAPLCELLADHQTCELGTQQVEHLVLFESRLRKTGPEYTVLVRERFGLDVPVD